MRQVPRGTYLYGVALGVGLQQEEEAPGNRRLGADEMELFGHGGCRL